MEGRSMMRQVKDRGKRQHSTISYREQGERKVSYLPTETDALFTLFLNFRVRRANNRLNV
jgi:hypothetical protein